ncbi:hypothetical protein SVIOM74S_00894 [Streptomyces violarus]
MCSLIVALAYPMREYVSQRAEVDDLQREQRQARQRVERLRDQKARWQDDAYAERQIRKRLDHVDSRGTTGVSTSFRPRTRARPARADLGAGRRTHRGTRTGRDAGRHGIDASDRSEVTRVEHPDKDSRNSQRRITHPSEELVKGRTSYPPEAGGYSMAMSTTERRQDPSQ